MTNLLQICCGFFAKKDFKEEEKDDLSFIRSNCVLGELYFGLNDFDKSRFHLEAALNTMNNCNLEKDLFDYEKLSASKILMKLTK